MKSKKMNFLLCEGCKGYYPSEEKGCPFCSTPDDAYIKKYKKGTFTKREQKAIIDFVKALKRIRKKINLMN